MIFNKIRSTIASFQKKKKNSLSIYTRNFLAYSSFYYLPYNCFLYSSLLLSSLPTTLQLFWFFIKLNRFCVFVAFLLYTIWFLSTSFIVRLKFYICVYKLCWKYKLLSFFISYSSHLIVFVVVLVDVTRF